MKMVTTKLIEGKQLSKKETCLQSKLAQSVYSKMGLIARTSSCGWNPPCKNFDKFPSSWDLTDTTEVVGLISIGILEHFSSIPSFIAKKSSDLKHLRLS